ncbi:PQQ-dependent sugar dehydrogenase [Cohnella thailandensis]|nr:PQQ-dependent sugar dehydrogenase [Cohnella thailandensis]MBP1972422.1 glucose/arabinose dehydrogenase [Cohnella thailandensis]
MRERGRQAWLLGLMPLLLVCLVLLASCENRSRKPPPASSPPPIASENETAGEATGEEPGETPAKASGGASGEKPGSGLNAIRLELEPLKPKMAYESLAGIEHAPGEEDSLYVLEQAGRIVRVPLSGSEEDSIFLDVRDRVFGEGSEQGLLGLAFDPDYETNGLIYVNYTTRTHTVISRFHADKGAANPGTEEVLLTFEQPYPNHNGGQLAFGPDGCLYIGTGDGGGAGDPHGNGQNKDTLLGKILRIDVDRTEAGKPYAIPADNVFAKGGGAPEIYAYGLRNPWRFSFDSATSRLWAADVGQNEIEEIDWIVSGGNYGWNVKEGTACFEPAEGCEPEGLAEPVWEYGRDEGQSVTGGYVYRGDAIPALDGWYVYGDYVSGRIWALRVPESGKPQNELLLESKRNITSFGTDGSGELYLCTPDEIYRLVLGE